MMRKLLDLKLETFMRYAIRINKLLVDEIKSKKLLDAAAKDSPIIAELMREINARYESKSSHATAKEIIVDQRELKLFLVLREMEKDGIL